MATKEQRVEIISKIPTENAIFFVKRGGQYWTWGNRGYSFAFTDAKRFSKEEIIERLTNNGLIDKEIVIYEIKSTI